MACENREALFLGVGSIKDVADCVANLPPEQGELSDALRALGGLLSQLSRSKGSEPGVRAILCAYSNYAFRETGKLWKVNDDLSMSYNSIEGLQLRETIAQAVGI